jgi:hypothetical protein
MKYKMRKGNVKMIKVYQIQLTDAEIAAVNNGETSDRIKAYFDRSFDGSFKAENFQYYTHVANVDTNDMEKAFELMNLWERPELVDKLAPCSSMSVGDILDVDGKLFRCASFGFAQLENYQRD